MVQQKMALMMMVLLGGVSGERSTHSDKITFRYFNARGLGESIRIYLAALHLDFDEVSYDRCAPDCPEGLTDWPTAKVDGIKNGLFPFGQVPSLTVESANGDVVNLVQSQGILRYLQREYGNPLTNVEHTRVDLIAGGAGDMLSKFSKFSYTKGGDREAYLKELKTWLPFFEKLLGPSQNFVEGKFTFVDALMYQVIDANFRVAGEYMLNDFPYLKIFYIEFAKAPRVHAYLSSSKRRPFSNGKSAFWDNADSPPVYVPQLPTPHDEHQEL